MNEAMNDAILIIKLIDEKQKENPHPILCELQLILNKQNSSATQKEKVSEMMNHYLYEIERATYGPLSELSLIIGTKDHRVEYLKKIKPLLIPTESTDIYKVCSCKNAHFSTN